MDRRRADALLLLVAFIWGTAFVAQKEAGLHIGPVFFVAARFLAAAVFLLPLAAWEARRSRTALTRADWIGAGGIGACLCAGSWFQQYGMESTSVTNAGFMTAVYMVMVPFIAWAFSGRPPRLLVLLACGAALAGAWMLGGGGAPAQWSRGDLIILAGDIVWALHITLVGHCRGMAARPVLLSLLQCAVTAGISVPVALASHAPAWEELRAALPAIAFAGLVSSGFAFTLQIVAQRHTPPAEAALIMSLESVFAAFAGAWWFGDSLSLDAWLGAGLIMLGVVLVETGGHVAGLFRLGRERPAPALLDRT